jgi:amino acid adenylation domain-containing protein
MSLHDRFVDACRRHPDRPAVKEAGGETITYAQLEQRTDLMRDALINAGVVPGDRVGVYLPKTVDSLIVLLGTLKAAAAYVPIDPGSPPARAAYILNNCSVRLVITDRSLAEPVTRELRAAKSSAQIVVLNNIGGGAGISEWLDAQRDVQETRTISRGSDEPAYILYTSGSTGQPKGVVISHRAAEAFVDWCIDTFNPTPEDRFSSHAPFHFDLSIHDIYVSLGSGACLVLIGEGLGKDPRKLAEAIDSERISIWYSTPSILSLLEQYGKLQQRDCRSIRIVHFAGEVFPIPRLRKVMERWSWPRFFNLYGPTETNVCTWFEVPSPLPAEWTEPLPIGFACPHYRPLVVEDGSAVEPGSRGELLMTGPGVMTGYWNLDDRNAAAFWTDAEGVRWYRTGDIVSQRPDGAYLFHGRRDRMVKRRGYRIELGEIESGLARHRAIASVAVVATADQSAGVLLTAFMVARGSEKPTIVELKQFCVRVR